MREPFRYRWLAVCVFVLSSTLNYLDRQLLSFFAPAIVASFAIPLAKFGQLLSAFSIAYAASALFTGWYLDRAGVNRGTGVAVAWWSTASIASAFAPGLRILAVCRAALGIGESAGVPAVGKLNGLYLEPEERALGAAVNQIGLTLGAMVAPLWIALPGGLNWRVPFAICGVLGFLWIPLWWFVSRRVPARYAEQEFSRSRRVQFGLLRDRNLQILIVVNVLWMGTYSLWSNWTTLYLVNAHHLTLRQAAHYVWIPPLISNIGGFFGGWLSLRFIRRGAAVVAGRRNAIWWSAVGSLVTLLLPFAPGAASATVVMSLSFFFVLAGSVNIYALPIDLYGPSQAAFGIAALTCAYGILQTVNSPLIGYLSDHHLYTQVIWICTLPVIAAAFMLRWLSVPRVDSSGAPDAQPTGASRQ